MNPDRAADHHGSGRPSPRRDRLIDIDGFRECPTATVTNLATILDTVTTTVPSGTVTSTATATATRTATVTATRTATVTATRGAGAARTERNGGLAFHDTGISMAPRHTHPVAAAATDTAPRAQLPETGAPSWIYPLLGSGLLLMASGAGMILASTRRKIRGSHTR